MSRFYYGVARGRNPGVYDNWEDCQIEVHQYSHSLYKKFSSRAEAESFVQRNSDSSYNPCSARSAAYFDDSDDSDDSDYEYTEPKRYSFNIDDDGYVIVYTDGACISNGRDNPRAGVGVWFEDNHPMNVSKPLRGRATNNRAEIEAVIEAAIQAKRAGIKFLKIYTDSKFLMSCARNWIPKWKANGWRTANNEPVINKSELIKMDKALAPLNVKWKHVNSHAGVYGNEMADFLARSACSRN